MHCELCETHQRALRDTSASFVSCIASFAGCIASFARCRRRFERHLGVACTSPDKTCSTALEFLNEIPEPLQDDPSHSRFLSGSHRLTVDSRSLSIRAAMLETVGLPISRNDRPVHSSSGRIACKARPVTGFEPGPSDSLRKLFPLAFVTQASGFLQGSGNH